MLTLSNTEILVELDILLKQRAELAQKEILLKKIMDDFHEKTTKHFYTPGEEAQLVEPRISTLIMKITSELGPRLVQDAIVEMADY